MAANNRAKSIAALGALVRANVDIAAVMLSHLVHSHVAARRA